MAALLTLQVPFAHYPLTRRALAVTVTTPVGNGARQVRRRYPRPIYEFTLRIAQAVKRDLVALTGFLAYHQQDRPFWFDGGEWGVVDTPILVGVGDGSTRQFFLPNRHILGALVTYWDGTPMPATLDAAAGLLTYGSAPALNVAVTATYTCRYKCTVYSADESLMSQANVGPALYSQEQVVLREFVP